MIFIHSRRLVKIIDHHIEIAVIIEICISSTVGVILLCHSPRFRNITEREVAVIFKEIVVYVDAG